MTQETKMFHYLQLQKCDIMGVNTHDSGHTFFLCYARGERNMISCVTKCMSSHHDSISDRKK